MAEGLQRIKSRTVSGGINTRFFPLDIMQDQAVGLQNIDASTDGIRQIRSGTNLVATGITYGPILAMSEYTPSSGTTELLTISAGGSAGDHFRLWKWNGQDPVFSLVGTLSGYTGYDSHETAIVTGFNSEPSIVKQIAVMSYDAAGTGTERWYYDGSTLTQAYYGADPGNAPKGEVFAYSNGRAFATGTGNFRNRVNISLVGNWAATGFTTVGTFDMGDGTRQNIVAMEPFRGADMIVYMEDRIELLGYQPGIYASGSAVVFNSWRREDVHTAIGGTSRNAVANAGEDQYFADQYGNIRSLARTIQDAGQGIRSLPDSEPIHTWIKRINPQARKRILCEAFDRWVIVGLPIDSATFPDHFFLLDLPLSSRRGTPVWYGPWKGSTNAHQLRCMTSATIDTATTAADKSPTLYVGSRVTTAGLVYRWFRGTDDSGEPITWQETTGRYNYGEQALPKSLQRIETNYVSAGTTVCVEANPDAKGWALVGYGSLTSSTTLLPQTGPFTLGGEALTKVQLSLEASAFERCYDVQFRFTVTASETVKSLGHELFAYPDRFEWDVTSG